MGWAVSTEWTTTRSRMAPTSGDVAGRGKQADCLADRAVDRVSVRSPGIVAQDANAIALLGEVDQLEVQGESLDHLGRPPKVQGRDLQRQALALHARLRERPGPTAAERDGAAADPLDESEQLGAALLGDHLPEQRSQEADLVGDGIPGPAQAEAGWLRGNGRKPVLRRAPRRLTHPIAGRRGTRGTRDAGGHAGDDGASADASPAVTGYGSTARAPSRYLTATNEGSDRTYAGAVIPMWTEGGKPAAPFAAPAGDDPVALPAAVAV